MNWLRPQRSTGDRQVTTPNKALEIVESIFERFCPAYVVPLAVFKVFTGMGLFQPGTVLKYSL